MNTKIMPAVIFIASLVYAAVLAVLPRWSGFESFLLIWLAGMLLLRPLYRSGSYWTEASILFLVWLWARGEAGPREVYLYLPLVSTVLMLAAHGTGMRILRLAVPPLVIAWFIAAGTPALDEAFFVTPGAMIYLSPCAMHHIAPCIMTWKTWFILVCTGLGLVIFAYDAIRKAPPVGKRADIILCSHSGNTAHYAGEFIKGMKEGGMEVIRHRFHYYSEFNPVLTGDTLVIAFPVSGWKPPWPFMSYMIFTLPRGKGKPAFVIYSSYGGPENAGIVAWVILTLKGYRVAGRTWAMYPMNVATFRIGTKRMWRFIDRLTPSKEDLGDAPLTGKEFASGVRTGLPFILWPFFLVPIGLAFDNRWINIALYRNRSWKRRCTRCGLCMSACPSERLHPDEDGYPRPKGTCALCLLCVNICPTNAMQMLLWTEYGHPYRPRWPELVVKKKDKSD